MSEKTRPLADFHASMGIEAAALAPVLKEVRANPESAIGRGGDKVVRNALAVLFTEDVFRNLHDDLRLHLEPPFYRHQPTMYALRSNTQMLLQEVFANTCTQHEVRNTAVFRELSQRMLVAGLDTLISFFPHRLEAGLRNANTMSWNMMLAIPRVYRRERQQDISPAEHEALCARNVELLTDIARLHMYAFSKLTEETRGADGQNECNDTYFTVADGRLDIRTSLIEHLCVSSAHRNVALPPATGCPALFAHSPDGHGNVIQYLHRWHMNVARKHKVFAGVADSEAL